MYKKIIILLLLMLVFTACGNTAENKIQTEAEKQGERLIMNYREENIRKIYLAGGCFWGVEGYFSRVRGITDAVSGYANGKTTETTYRDIAETDHAETVEISYDMSVISLEEVLLHYFRIIEPTSVNKQGNDRGRQYRTGVYYTDEAEKVVIDKIFAYMTEIHGQLAVESGKLEHFILAEDYHQDYLDKNPNGYCHINLASANEPLFTGKYQNPSDDELKQRLDELSYNVLRESATERPHTSELNAEYRRGIYVDKITGEPLFASQDKFDAGCGWPSFSKPILSDRIDYLADNSLARERVEVRSHGGDNHLGHVFDDGPAEMGGLRYCINGAALEFIPYEEMEAKGYGAYKMLTE